jgi:spermidine/putrescine transport system substrate-binding protein
MNISKTIDRLAAGSRVSRRELNAAMTGLGLATVAVPLVGGKARAAADMVEYFTWSGYEVPELHPAFVEKYGDGHVAGSFFGGEEEALSKLRTGFNADVAHPCSYSVRRWVDAGVAGPIDTSRLSNWPDVFPQLQNLEDTVFDGQNYFVPFDWGSSSVLYRTDLVDPMYEEDPTWAIMYDERYAGRLTMYDTDVIITIAAMIKGYDNLATLSDEQLAELRPDMEKMNANMRFYWTDSTQVTQALASGEIVAGYAWNGMMGDLIDQGLPVAYMNPKEGQITWVCGLTRDPRGDADEQMVYDFIDAMISVEAGIFQIEEYNYGHSNKLAFADVSEETLQRMGMSNVDAVFESGLFIPSSPPEYEEKYLQLADEIKAGF